MAFVGALLVAACGLLGTITVISHACWPSEQQGAQNKWRLAIQLALLSLSGLAVVGGSLFTGYYFGLDQEAASHWPPFPMPTHIVGILENAISKGIVSGGDAAQLNKWMNYEVRGTPRAFNEVSREIVIAPLSTEIVLKLRTSVTLSDAEKRSLLLFVAAHDNSEIPSAIRTLLLATVQNGTLLSLREREMFSVWNQSLRWKHLERPSPIYASAPQFPVDGSEIPAPQSRLLQPQDVGGARRPVPAPPPPPPDTQPEVHQHAPAPPPEEPVPKPRI